MRFCTSIHCMDGRIQLPLDHYLKEHYGVEYVDNITEPGPCKILAENEDQPLLDSIRKRIDISVQMHHSRLIAISGHFDCAGNPCGEAEQKKQIKTSMNHLQMQYPSVKIIGLWIDSKWDVHPI